jgi:hypothetical protein
MVDTVMEALRVGTIRVFTMQNMLDTITTGLPIQHTTTTRTRTPIRLMMVGTLMLQLEATLGPITPTLQLQSLTLPVFIQVAEVVQAEQEEQEEQGEQEALVEQVVLVAQEEPELQVQQAKGVAQAGAVLFS